MVGVWARFSDFATDEIRSSTFETWALVSSPFVIQRVQIQWTFRYSRNIEVLTHHIRA